MNTSQPNVADSGSIPRLVTVDDFMNAGRSIIADEEALFIEDGDTEQKRSFLPAPPSFPLDVFPPRCRDALGEISRAYCCPVEIPASALLVAAGGCIGRTRAIQIKKGWREFSNLFISSVGDSGIGKSPATKEILRPIHDWERRWFTQYEESMRQYREIVAARKKEKGASSEPEPEPPKWKQILVQDATIEAIGEALQQNPRGLLWNHDELEATMLNLDRYTPARGGTKPMLQACYDSAPWKINRVCKKMYIPHATLGIFGTVQPRILPEIFSSRDCLSGFLPRFIFVIAQQDNPPLFTEACVSPQSRAYLDALFGTLIGLDFDEEGNGFIVPVEDGAKTLFRRWFNRQATEPFIDLEAEEHKAIMAKLRGQCLRVALILHCIESYESMRSEVLPVTGDTMGRAVRLMDCLKEHQKICFKFVTDSEAAAKTLTAIHRRVVRAIVDLAPEIQGGRLLTKAITSKVNEGHEVGYHLTTHTVGKVCAGPLALPKSNTSQARGFTVDPEKLAEFQSLCSN